MSFVPVAIALLPASLTASRLVALDLNKKNHIIFILFIVVSIYRNEIQL